MNASKQSKPHFSGKKKKQALEETSNTIDLKSQLMLKITQ